MFNVSIVIGIISATVAQIIKVIVTLITEKQFKWVTTGGMPSSHSAGVVACATSVGIIDGWDSSVFAVAVALSVVVMYDATGVRRAAGVHAEYLNVISQELSHIFKKDGQEQKALKTLLGHTYLQVISGLTQGVLVSLLIHYYFLK